MSDPRLRGSRDTALEDALRRIRVLERVLSVGTGIRFDTDNEGGWLWIVGRGCVTDTDRSILIQAIGGGDCGTGDIEIDADPATGILSLSGSQIAIDGGGGTVAISGDVRIFPSDDLLVELVAGKKLLVKDSGGNPIFEVREDGSVHIKTGTSVVSDL